MSGIATFEAERPRLYAIAYGMLGQVMDAEDIVQEAFVRWNSVDVAAVVNPAAYLTTITTRLAIDRLRSAQVRREEYVGPWLPEPIVTDPSTAGADPGDLVAEAEQISLAFLLALERLNPVERAALLLREVFDCDYAEIAEVVDRTVDNCRQIVRRSRDRVGDGTRRFPVTPEREQELIEVFLGALADGDVERLRSALAADITLWSDGGGQVRAARRPIVGAPRVAQFLVSVRRFLEPDDELRLVTANGYPALYAKRQGKPHFLLTVLTSADGIVGIQNLINPDRVGYLAGPLSAEPPGSDAAARDKTGTRQG